jgi:hypothetical protein
MLLKPWLKLRFTEIPNFLYSARGPAGRTEQLDQALSHNAIHPSCRRAVGSWPHWLLLFILAAVTIVYIPTLHDGFHGDDFVAFTEFKTHNFWNYSSDVFLFKDANFYWRPLGKISHFLLYEFFDFDPSRTASTRLPSSC